MVVNWKILQRFANHLLQQLIRSLGSIGGGAIKVVFGAFTLQFSLSLPLCLCQSSTARVCSAHETILFEQRWDYSVGNERFPATKQSRISHPLIIVNSSIPHHQTNQPASQPATGEDDGGATMWGDCLIYTAIDNRAFPPLLNSGAVSATTTLNWTPADSANDDHRNIMGYETIVQHCIGKK